MNSRYGITIQQVRETSGIDVDLITDEKFASLIEDAEYVTEKDLNCKGLPVNKIELVEGDETNRIMLNNNPVTRLRKIMIGTDEVDLDDVRLDKQGGNVWLSGNVVKTKKNAHEKNLVRVNYEYGLLEETTVQTYSTADIVAGSGVIVPVLSSVGFNVGDYVEISGFDSKVETFKITNVPNALSVKADLLGQGHESNSLLTIVETPRVFKRLIKVNAALMGCSVVIGTTYTIMVNYGLGDLNVNKGVPYTHWARVSEKLLSERNDLLTKFRQRPVVM
jgi:hypothetical protein